MASITDQFSRFPLCASVFVRRASRAYGQLDGSELRLRELDGTKEFLEEVLPIATFLAGLSLPGLGVRCLYCRGSQPYDGQIWLDGDLVERGFLQAHYFIEVTVAGSRKEYLIREALERYGGVFLDDHICRKGRRNVGGDRIVSRAQARAGGRRVEDAITWVREAIQRKCCKNYPNGTILIVAVNSEGRLSLEDWALLTRKAGGCVDREKFSRVFVVHCDSAYVFPV